MPIREQNIIMEFTKKVKQLLGNRLSKIVLYGSYARGDFNKNSDIDIMVLTTLTDIEIEGIESDIYGLAFNFLMDYGVDISVVIKNKQQFDYWLGALPFYDNVQKEGVVLYDKNSDGNLVTMNIETVHKREQILKMRERILQAEQERIDERETISLSDARKRLRERVHDLSNVL